MHAGVVSRRSILVQDAIGLHHMQKMILGWRSCRRTGLGYRRSVLAKCGALEVLDAVRVGPAERLNAASAQLLAVLSLP